jgi:LysM repeat protein
MQITHAEAHKLIQFSMDEALKPQEKNILQTHLNDCMECQAFVEQLKAMENLLVPAMTRHWAVQPAPLLIETLTDKKTPRRQASIILATRTAIISIVFAAFVFSTWQFTHSSSQPSSPLSVSVLPIPTPSRQSTSTKISFQNCEQTIYQVQENDTLESIALKFSVAKDKIMAANNLNAETVSPKMELLIPICTSTPTGTVHPSTLTITFTPLTGPTTSTPGGS